MIALSSGSPGLTAGRSVADHGEQETLNLRVLGSIPRRLTTRPFKHLQRRVDLRGERVCGSKRRPSRPLASTQCNEPINESSWIGSIARSGGSPSHCPFSLCWPTSPPQSVVGCGFSRTSSRLRSMPPAPKVKCGPEVTLHHYPQTARTRATIPSGAPLLCIVT